MERVAVMLQKNQIIDLAVTDMTHEGSGVGHYEGVAVFVPASAVGDCLRVRILKVNKTHCFGKIEQVMSPSPDRVETDCPVSRRCRGCVFRHVSYAAQLRYKQHFVQSNLERIGGFSLLTELIEPSPQIDGYRNKAQYPVRMQKGKLAAGFFAPRTHEVIDCHSCLLQPPGFPGHSGIGAFLCGEIWRFGLRRTVRAGTAAACLSALRPAEWGNYGLPGGERFGLAARKRIGRDAARVQSVDCFNPS